MKTKNFLVGGIVGAIVYFLLGWLIYGILLKDVFSSDMEETTETLVYIFLGGLAYCLLIAYIFTKWAQISTAGGGFTAGAVIGLFIGLNWNLYGIAFMESTLEIAALDVVVTIVMTGIIGAVIGMVNGKMG